jgi:hypothetical protein
VNAALYSNQPVRFFELNEIWEWCAERGIEVEDRTLPAADSRLSHVARTQYASGQRSGREGAVAARCVRALGEWDECLLWITQTGIWSSSEDWPAYYAMRGARGERRSIENAPGHCFEDGEEAPLTQFLTAVMENGWDAYVMPAVRGAETGVRLRISHDEYVELQSRRPVESDALAV